MGDSRVQGQGPDKGSGGRSRPKIEAFLLPARHYASAGTSNGAVFVYVCLSVCVCHKSVSYNVTQFAQVSETFVWRAAKQRSGLLAVLMHKYT